MQHERTMESTGEREGEGSSRQSVLAGWRRSYVRPLDSATPFH